MHLPSGLLPGGCKRYGFHKWKTTPILGRSFSENRTMNWNDVRYLLAVARHGGLTGASRELKVSQSTVARRVETLEAALHTRLFERRTNGYELTEAGRGMVERAEAVESRMVEMASDFRGQDAEIAGAVRISTIETLAVPIIIPRLAAFQQNYPGLSLGVAIQASFARLPQREADIGVRLCRPEQGLFAVKRLGMLAFGLYASPEYLSRHAAGGRSHPISGHQLIAWSDPVSYIALPKLMRSWTVDGTIALTVDSMQGQMLAIRSGFGLGILPCIMANGDEKLVRLHPPSCHHEEAIWLVVHNDIRHARRIRVVTEFLEATIKEQQPALSGSGGT
jgi:molybdate transport repressor ModE-like protein